MDKINSVVKNEVKNTIDARVCAIVVSYFPISQVLARVLGSIEDRVSHVLLVDNTPEVEIEGLKGLDSTAIQVIRLCENKGVATAHNVGIRWARERGYTHVLLMDQDSIAAPDMVGRLLEAVGELKRRRKKVAAVTPWLDDKQYRKANTFIRQEGLRRRRISCGKDTDQYIRCDYVVSSGALISMEVIETVGEMDETLFVDYVDIEWGLRAQSKGFDFFGVCNATLEHRLGDAVATIPLIKGFYAPVRSPLRHYYHFRNAILLYKRPYVPFAWVVNDAWRLILKFFFYALVTSPRREHLKMMCLGIWHAIRGRSGPLLTEVEVNRLRCTTQSARSTATSVYSQLDWKHSKTPYPDVPAGAQRNRYLMTTYASLSENGRKVSHSSALGRVAVVIVNWNSGLWLNACLDALFKQSLLPSRVLVVDNASSDTSLVDSEGNWPDVEFIRLEKNFGFAEANNLAIKQIDDCEWIALLNPDAIPHGDWLEQLLSAAQEYPECVCFGSRQLQFHDPSRLDGIGDAYHISGAHWRMGHGRVANASDLEVKAIFSPCAAAALYRTEGLREVGGLDRSFFCFAEDVDLAFRLRLIGHSCLYVPQAVVDHVGSAMTGKHSDFSIYYGHRNMVWTYFKNMPWPLFWLYLPQHILLNLVSFIWFSLHRQMRVIFKSKWDALKGLPRVLQERKRVQASRLVSAWEIRRVMERGLLAPYRKRT